MAVERVLVILERGLKGGGLFEPGERSSLAGRAVRQYRTSSKSNIHRFIYVHDLLYRTVRSVQPELISVPYLFMYLSRRWDRKDDTFAFEHVLYRGGRGTPETHGYTLKDRRLSPWIHVQGTGRDYSSTVT